MHQRAPIVSGSLALERWGRSQSSECRSHQHERRVCCGRREVELRAILLHSLLVGSGGFAGALLRYALAGALHRHLPLATFPYGTLCVNLVGCLLIGAFAGLADSRQLFAPEVRV